MSADNYLVVFENENGSFSAYMGFMSNEVKDDDLRKYSPVWVARNYEEAMEKIDAEELLEYGFRFNFRGLKTDVITELKEILNANVVLAYYERFMLCDLREYAELGRTLAEGKTLIECVNNYRKAYK